MTAKLNSYYLNEAALFFERGDYFSANISIQKFLEHNPENIDGLLTQGIISSALGNHQSAIKSFDILLSADPNNSVALFSKANSLFDLKSYLQAINCYESALNINHNYFDCYLNKGDTHFAVNQFEEALLCFDMAIALNPKSSDIWNNKGASHNELRQYDDALSAFQCALNINPNNAKTWANIANTFANLGQLHKANSAYDEALAIDPRFVGAYFNKGNTLFALKLYEEALRSYKNAFSLNENYPFLKGALLHLSMSICSWIDYPELKLQLLEDIKNGRSVTPPLPLLSITPSELLHLQAAQTWIANKFTTRIITKNFDKSLKPKIILGYFSADFYNHAVSNLIAEVFELHDRYRFEVIAFSYGPPRSDSLRMRLMQGFDQFIDIENISDEAAAKLSNDLGVDIAIDLTGLTKDGRTGIFLFRAAPIQINYLGYPGTIGSGFYDYVIADPILIPETCRKFYTEKIAYLPNTYQANDSQRPISNINFTKEELGLPNDSFIFCCFNNNFKITPEIFNIWMGILKSVDGSVLWLLEDNQIAKSNLITEALNRGVNSDRLIFAKRMPSSEHLARQKLADLFLDTSPYNAHTTCSDALWTGLPVLTCKGESFAGRVGASLLNALDMNVLVTNNLEDYKFAAVQLALNSDYLAEIKLKISQNKITMPLFNSELFTKNLESLYLKMIYRHSNCLPPDHIACSET